jgi:protein SCO1
MYFSLLQRLSVIGCLLALVACGGPYIWRSGALLDAATTAPEVVLTNQDGQPFTLSQQTGVVTLLFFGFTNCPDVCPTTLADLAAARKKLGTDGDKIRVVLITVDPARDTPERLGRYVQTFDPTFIALSGTEAELQAVYQSYGVTAIRRDVPNSALGYTIDHNASVYVIDQSGHWRALISNGAAIDDIVADLRYLISSGGN